MLEILNQWDTQLLLYVNGLHNSFLDPIMVFFSKTTVWIPFYAVILFFIFYKDRWNGFAYLRQNEFWGISKAEAWRGLAVFVFAVLVIVFADRGSVELFKNVFKRYRPGHEPEIKDMVRMITGRGGKYGFVSSHAANTFGFAAFTALYFSKRYFSLFILFWAAIIAYSRVYLGKHYPGDVLGGAILGAVIGYLVFKAYEWFYAKYVNKTKPNLEAQV